jgi:hypothetical protein
VDELTGRVPKARTALVTTEVTGWASALADAMEAAATDHTWDIDRVPLPEGVYPADWRALVEKLSADAARNPLVQAWAAALSPEEQRVAARRAALLVAGALRQLPRPG